MIELLTILPAIFGGTSATIAVTNFALTHSRKLNTWQSLRDGLQKFSQTPGRLKTTDEELIINWLSYGDLIVAPLRVRLLERLGLTIAVIVGLTALSACYPMWNQSNNTSDLNNVNYSSEILIDVVIGIAQIFIGLINGTGFLLRKEEQQFLIRLKALHLHFYENYVIPAMREFNYQADDSPLFANILEAHSKEQEKIRNHVINDIAKRLGIPVDQLNNFIRKEGH